MKSIRRIAAGALAAAAVLTPAAANADTPYAQASAVVEADGTIANSEHVSDAWHPRRGTYCITVDESVDLAGSVAIHATVTGNYDHPRSLSVELWSPACGYGDKRTIAVFSKIVYGQPADTGFYLSVS
ncbi:hypothetical protein [Nonomuraea zeae]|uniref:Uncharacterized protein n=1 Tax=Nonomuraea zeae TaxID=1642303 RepID=A0A5S4FDZ6_9ACTN|nr:hypothetical protein [Nonomuraea zeae]TMR16744.1 hypothetical protein ETD85_54895 [Nonomuraea zeae]